MQEVNVFWFRRDLRLTDNTGLQNALSGNRQVLPLFIFDMNILNKLPKEDRRIDFIHYHLSKLNKNLSNYGSSLLILHDKPIDAFKKLCSEYSIKEVFTNHDYEPYSIQRDKDIQIFLAEKNIQFHTFKDQVIFEKSEVTKSDGRPYTVFTPYSRRWKEKYRELPPYKSPLIRSNFLQTSGFPFPDIHQLGFTKTLYKPDDVTINENLILNYHKTRDIPGIQGTSNLGVHLRFGTISIREVVAKANTLNQVFLNELIWREFFMSIIYQFPHVEHQSFKKEYDNIEWRNNIQEFECWCRGETGYPMVDAGMRELNATGYMHNRVRMITAGFLCKHLLIDWRWGETWFASKLLDYELSSNNGNWQWAAGTGCDAAPYFRIFNPSEQLKKFDPDLKYIRRWIPEFNSLTYARPIVDHSFARERALNAYKKARII